VDRYTRCLEKAKAKKYDIVWKVKDEIVGSNWLEIHLERWRVLNQEPSKDETRDFVVEEVKRLQGHAELLMKADSAA
jgi:hypothetical protein